MKYSDVIIIGGGASGTMCAIFASDNNKKVTIIDKQNKLTKKILVTGNGRCNLTNVNVTSEKYNRNIDTYLKMFNVKSTLQFFKSIGLEVYQDEQGRVYPFSNSAKSVMEVLQNAIQNKKVDIQLETEVLNVSKKQDEYILQTDNGLFACKKLVIATGGNTILKILQNLDENFKQFSPSLVSLKTQNIKNLANVRLNNVKVTAQNAFGQTKTEFGEVLFKECGLSGICIFNLSALFSRNNNFKGLITIDLLPNFQFEEVFNLLNLRKKLNLPINKFFDGLFVREIAYEILNRIKINENRLSSALAEKELKLLTQQIKNFSFDVKSCYDNQQVFSGGVILESLTQNLESLKNKNLFFCGEICDVDGLCGGFNLQWAWTSGKIVGESL